jgi:ABC-type polysaccharide/polyol phosphate export permease
MARISPTGDQGIAAQSALARLYALALRERKTRFAGASLGALWAYAYPIGWIVVMVIAFAYLGRTTPIYVSMPLFVATGILPYALFRQLLASMPRARAANRYLIYFAPIRFIDITLAAALAEAVTFVVVALVVFVGISVLFDGRGPDDVLGVVGGLGLAWVVGASLGQLAAALGALSDTIGRVIPLLLRPMFWISGVFFTANELGQSVLNILWYNPLFHCIEILREGYFLGFQSPVSSYAYPLALSSACFLAALLIDRMADRQMMRGATA